MQNLRYKCLYVIGFWKSKQCSVIVCKYLFNARIKSDYVAIFVTWPQSLNCLFHIGITILDVGWADGRVVGKKVWSFLSRKHSHKCFRKVFCSVSVSFSKLYWRWNWQFFNAKFAEFVIYVEAIIYLLWHNNVP